MNCRQASAILRCSDRHIRASIAAGSIRATQVPAPLAQGYVWDIAIAEILRVRDLPKIEKRGWPRGKSRGSK